MNTEREITYTSGDATAPTGCGAKIIAQICNDIGGWGKGFVVAISRRWSEPEADYRRWHSEREQNDFGLGSIRIVPVTEELSVANLVAQRGIGRRGGAPPIRYPAVRACLQKLGAHAQASGASVHMPRIGCGLAGGEWSQIEPIIREELLNRGVRVTVYDFP